ncbi:MAG: molybdopterin molybdotransferase MoeA [Desulfovibrionaceae bacterium]|nr:molybdopterin molybdotransferase MoeA [Desulfovibrionaceae bacterium]
MQKDFFCVRSLEEVTAYLQASQPLAAQMLSLEALATGGQRPVLAYDVLAQEDLPMASRSGMDGYAVQAQDTFGAGEANPAYLECVGQVHIEKPAAFSLQRGQCAAIVTGGCLPEGADAVVMVEHTLDMGANCIEIRKAVPPREHVMLRGEDALAGHCALAAGTVLRPQEVGLLAALGMTTVAVHRAPRVAILSTGDELVPPAQCPRVGQVRDVNSFTLAAMVQAAGGQAHCLGIVNDDCASLEAALRKAVHEADVVLLSGGSSIGVRDCTLAALQALPEAELFCHGVALSPGKPLILARVAGKSVWGLPGQVTSAQVVMTVLGQPFLRRLQGYATPFDRTLWRQCPAVLTRNVASKQGREDFVRVALTLDEAGQWQARPVLGKSGLLRTLVQAQGLVHIPASYEGLEGGSAVKVLLFE